MLVIGRVERARCQQHDVRVGFAGGRGDLFEDCYPQGLVPFSEGSWGTEGCEFEARAKEHGFFVERPRAERTPAWKQVIPYCVVAREDEVLVLRRKVVWVNLPGAESAALDAALASAEKAAGEPLPRIRTGRWSAADVGPCDHLWLCSVLTDPDRFPALHDELYGRRGTPEAVGGGHPKREREEAGRLVDAALACLTDRAPTSFCLPWP